MADFTGTNGPDTLIGGNENDTIIGLEGDDFLNGRDGNDRLLPGLGTDVVFGGEGRDTVSVTGTLGQYETFRYNGQAVLRGPEGVDRLFDVEAIDFTGGSGTVEVKDVAVFQALSYNASYKDLAQAFGTNKDAGWDHFREAGANEGRSATFNGSEYIASHGDLINAFKGQDWETLSTQGAVHKIQFGFNEGRETTFDGLQYLASHDDLVQAFRFSADPSFMDDVGAMHYINNGFAEGRAADTFDALAYSAKYSDLAAAYGTNQDALALHYISYGQAEGRSDALFV